MFDSFLNRPGVDGIVKKKADHCSKRHDRPTGEDQHAHPGISIIETCNTLLKKLADYFLESTIGYLPNSLGGYMCGTELGLVQTRRGNQVFTFQIVQTSDRLYSLSESVQDAVQGDNGVMGRFVSRDRTGSPLFKCIMGQCGGDVPKPFFPQEWSVAKGFFECLSQNSHSIEIISMHPNLLLKM